MKQLSPALSMRAVSASFVLTVMLLIFPAALHATEADGGSAAGTLVFGVEAEFTGFDPIQARGAAICDAIVNAAVHETLFRMNEDGQIVPVLALSATPAPDETSWRIELREGVRFHDGTPFDAEAVVRHFSRLLDPANRFSGRAYIEPIRAVEKVDAQTVRFHLAHPWPPFLAALANTRAMGAHIPSPRAVEAGTQMRAPVGTGPFMFKQWQSGERLVIVRNPAYRQAGRPRLEAVVFMPIPDDQTRFASLESGQTDMIWTDRGHIIAQAANDPALAHYQGEGSGAEIFVLNTTRPPLDDVRVRQALAHAWNQDVCVQMSYGGSIPSVCHPFGADVPLGAVGYRSYDPEVARALLAEVGRSIHLECLHSNSKRGSEQGQLFQQFGKQVGIGVTPIGLAFGPVVKKVVSKDYQVSTWRMPPGPDQGPSLYAAFHSRSPRNVTGYRNPQMDELLEAQRRETDPALRQALLAEIATLINRDVPILYRGGRRFHVLAASRVKGIGRIQEGIVPLAEVWVAP